MPTSSVKEFAELVAIPVDRLLRQLEDAGVAGKDAADVITDDEKNELLGYLRRSHGVAEGDPSGKPKKIVLKRTVTGELRQASSTRRKTSGLAAQTNKVKLVVKRRRTYVKRTEIEGEPTEEQTRPDETQPLTQVEAAAASEPVVATLVPATDVVAARETEQPVPGADRPNLGQAPAQVSDPSAEVPAGRSAAQPARQLPRSPKPDLKPGTPPKGPFTRGKGKTEDRDSRRDKALRDIKVSRKRSKGRAGEQTPKSAARHQFEMPAEAQKKEVRVGDAITVADLANRMSVKAAEVIKALMGLGQMVTINQTLDQDTAILVVEEMGHRAVAAPDENPELLLTSPEAAVGTPRAPVVTVMGHVDHGKTSLLDYIRKTRVAAGESGGITQHIGAYHVVTANGPITFLDTPGHEAFSAMRARGARVTDVVVLVVAADDGVMPQTQEAIEHARASQVPVIVAINKIDKPQADVAKVKQDLVGRGLVPEEWGGDTLFVEVSAKTGAGIDTLLESLALQAEILELVAPAEGPAEGVVIESRLDRGRGPVATVLIQKGCLKKGDIVLAGQVYGRARMIFDAKGETQQDAGPSMPIEIQGLSGIPNVGDPVNVVVDERRAREIAEYRGGRAREANLTARIDGPSEDIFSQLREQRIKVLNIIVKADVQGSVEALADALRRLSNEEVAVKVVASGVGGIIETDVNLAISTGSLLIGFNVRADATARRMIQAHGVELRYYSVIYEAIDEVKAALGGMLEPEIRQQIIGLAEVRDVFHSKKLGAIAGCVVVEGSVRRNSPIRVLRDNVVIFEGQLESLRRIKDDVGEVKSGTECGIGVKDYNDVRIGDQIECFEVVRVERKI